MAHKECGELKKRAWLAKQRLKMGYWESVRAEERASVAPVTDSSVSGAVYARVRYLRDVDNSESAALDEKMYAKVCAILDRDEATINPIGQLIDNDVYSKLDPASKQRYILELSNKFREFKERYEREKIGS